MARTPLATKATVSEVTYVAIYADGRPCDGISADGKGVVIAHDWAAMLKAKKFHFEPRLPGAPWIALKSPDTIQLAEAYSAWLKESTKVVKARAPRMKAGNLAQSGTIAQAVPTPAQTPAPAPVEALASVESMVEALVQKALAKALKGLAA